MFSGIIKNKAKIINKKDWIYTVENIFWKELKKWISIAHDWACMTIIDSDLEKYSFFVMEESIKKTNFKNKNIWDYFNIEWSLRLSDTMDWHFVSWHIDTIWKVIDIKENNDWSNYYFISFDKKYSNLIIEKWSITINWVSLTIVEDWNDFLSVSIIPLTQEITNIWDLQIWDIVNLEFDILGKYINKIKTSL